MTTLPALLLLIFETTNDYVRFHGESLVHIRFVPSALADTFSSTAYQSGLLTTPIILLWLVMTLIGFWRWLR